MTDENEALCREMKAYYQQRQLDGGVYSAGSFEAGWCAAMRYNASIEPVEYPPSPPSQMEREIAKLLHIEYCEDLAEEGTPWEVLAEPEPSYFATLKEAIEFRESLPEDASSPQVTPPKYDPSWHGSQAHTFVTDKPVGSEVKPRTQPCRPDKLPETCEHGTLLNYTCVECEAPGEPRTGDKS